MAITTSTSTIRDVFNDSDIAESFVNKNAKTNGYTTKQENMIEFLDNGHPLTRAGVDDDEANSLPKPTIPLTRAATNTSSTARPTHPHFSGDSSPHSSSSPDAHSSITNGNGEVQFSVPISGSGYPITGSRELSSSWSYSTHRSLYQRATTAFVNKEFGLAYEILEDAFRIIGPLPPSEFAERKEAIEWRIKWDILRVTIEALLYADSSLLNPTRTRTLKLNGHGQTKGKAKSTIPPALEHLLVTQSPSSFVETITRRSLDLFEIEEDSMGGLPPGVALTLIMAGLKVEAAESSKEIAENWLSYEGENREREGYQKMLRGYTCQVLPHLGEWDLAQSYIGLNTELDGEEKMALMERVRETRRRMEGREGKVKGRGRGRDKEERNLSRSRLNEVKNTPPMVMEREEEGDNGTKGVLRKGVTSPKGGVEVANGSVGIVEDMEPERVCSPASGSSSSSFMTHSTHTAVPSPSRTPRMGLGGVGMDGRVEEDGESERTETITERGGGRVEERRIGKRRLVGSLKGYILERSYQVGRGGRFWMVVIGVIGLMGMYYQMGSVRRKRGDGNWKGKGTLSWIRQSFVDFGIMAFRGFAL